MATSCPACRSVAIANARLRRTLAAAYKAENEMREVYSDVRKEMISLLAERATELADCRRQLAAANERARRLEAQMVELREGWPSFEYVDDTEGMVAVEVPEVVIQNFHRILGGA